MESLPDALVQCILSQMNNAKDVATCNCVSKRWKEALPYLKSLYFPRNLFDNLSGIDHPDNIIWKMIASVVRLEELVVYTPFTSAGLASWLLLAGLSLKHLELRMDNIAEIPPSAVESPLKVDCIGIAKNLETLKLWGLLMTGLPKWDGFLKLTNLEIVGARLEDSALSAALQASPNLRSLLLLGCEGIRTLEIGLPHLEQCKLDFYGSSHCSLTLTCPRIHSLEVQGCSWIRVPETDCLRNLSIANNTGRVSMLDFGKLAALEMLSMRGIQWSWDAVSRMLKLARGVKYLYMKIEFTGDHSDLQPFPEVDFADFFRSHPKLQKFELHGAMFAALCQKNSLKSVGSSFVIPSLQHLVVTIRSPLNAEHKICTLESLLNCSKNLKCFVIRILQMKSNHMVGYLLCTDDFFDDVCRLRHMHHKIVRIE